MSLGVVLRLWPFMYSFRFVCGGGDVNLMERASVCVGVLRMLDLRPEDKCDNEKSSEYE